MAAVKQEETGGELYQRRINDKNYIVRQLRKRGFRFTKQREAILDAILNHECTSCKEIYYQAIAKDPGIGMATVYRMVNTLMDIGVLKAASLKPASSDQAAGGRCVITMSDQRTLVLSREEVLCILKEVVKNKGYSDDDIVKIEIK